VFFKAKIHDNKLQVNPAWRPPTDPVFQYLWQEAMFGQLPVFFGAVPLPRVIAFDPTFHPETTPGGEEVVRAVMQDWRKGIFQKVWTYPRGELFVSSDDYFTLAAAERGQPDFLPCWILGRPAPGSAKDVQGPMAQDRLRSIVGLKI
jgi:hypothetical protein